MLICKLQQNDFSIKSMSQKHDVVRWLNPYYCASEIFLPRLHSRLHKNCCWSWAWTRCSPVSIHLPLDAEVEESEEVESSRGLQLPVQFLQDDLLHAHHVRHREAVLADADQVVGQRDVLLLLRRFHSDVKTAEAHTGQVFGLNLRTKEER